jgi:predicted TIM-barrel fold metal-dependent hydrolase
LADLANDQSETTFILEHLGGPLGVGPYAKDPHDVEVQWKAGLRRVAQCPNVFFKISGIGMARFGVDWEANPRPPTSKQLADVWGDRVRWCIDLFGADRCMFGSNFPVDRLSCSYTVLWNAFTRMVTDASPTETSLLFRDSAIRAYRLSPID